MLEGLDATRVHMLFDLLDSQREGSPRRVDTNNAASTLMKLLEELEDGGLIELFELDEDPEILIVEVLQSTMDALDARRAGAPAPAAAADVQPTPSELDADDFEDLAVQTLAPFSSAEVEAAPMQFWIKAGDRLQGPYSADKVLNYAVQGRLKAAHQLSDDKQNWIPATEHELVGALVKAVIATSGKAEAAKPMPESSDDVLAVPASERKRAGKKRRRDKRKSRGKSAVAEGQPIAAPAQHAVSGPPADVIVPRTIGVTCEGCLYFTGGADGVGICARMPPRPVYPIVQKSGWCGEWRSTDDPDLTLTDVIGSD